MTAPAKKQTETVLLECKRCTSAYVLADSRAICQNLFCSALCEQVWLFDALRRLAPEDRVRVREKFRELRRVFENSDA